jgi:hypothetical protein
MADLTQDSILRRAGIERARGLVCAVDSDAANVYITLTGRSINPDLFIVARASGPASPEHLYRAGADRVIAPFVSSDRHMALLGLRLRVVDYLDIVGLAEKRVRLEEILIEAVSRRAGMMPSSVTRKGNAHQRAPPTPTRAGSGLGWLARALSGSDCARGHENADLVDAVLGVAELVRPIVSARMIFGRGTGRQRNHGLRGRPTQTSRNRRGLTGDTTCRPKRDRHRACYDIVVDHSVRRNQDVLAAL